MSLFKESSTNTLIQKYDYAGAHPILSETHIVKKSVQNDVGKFQKAEPGVKEYLKKKKSNLSNYITHKKEKRHDRLAKKKSDKSAHTIVAAIVKANAIIDSEKQHAWEVEKKQRRKQKAPESGDENARKELEKSIRTEVWSELKLDHRKNHKSEAFDKEIMGAFDILSAKN
tara:strand:+ start:1676 stop:2188 length:513 start_codon:yes stop_codon:yes gene_type:complete